MEFLTGKDLTSVRSGKLWYVSVGTEMYAASALVLAAGVARGKKFPGEAELLGRGVSYCATCDGMLYRGREVAIVGGGSTAVGAALTLARLAGRVTLIHRRDALRAAAVYLDKLRENGVNIVTKVLQYWCDFGADKYRTQRVLQKCYIIVTILEHLSPLLLPYRQTADLKL